jgi:hypothetical protein
MRETIVVLLAAVVGGVLGLLSVTPVVRAAGLLDPTTGALVGVLLAEGGLCVGLVAGQALAGALERWRP